MGHVGFPRLQILRHDGTWLPWIDGSEWCAPPGTHSVEFFAKGIGRVELVESQAHSDALGKLPAKTGAECTLDEWTRDLAEARGAR